MHTRNTLIEIATLISKAHRLLETVIASQPKPTSRKPLYPQSGEVATGLWNNWEKLRGLKHFTARQAKQIVTGKDGYDPAYSGALSKWARENHIDVIRPGSGRKPAIYKIPNETA